jgi:predicted membrane protein
VQQNLVCVAIFGSVMLDLRGALIEGDEVNVRAFTAFGSVEVIVPEGVEVDLTGLALFGSKETRGKPGTLRRGAALVRVNAFVLFGSTEVQVKTPR